MPLNPHIKLATDILNTKIFKQMQTRARQDASAVEKKQDELFRNMSAEQKIKLASDFYTFAIRLKQSTQQK